jgi:hypothetical protein
LQSDMSNRSACKVQLLCLLACKVSVMPCRMLRAGGQPARATSRCTRIRRGQSQGEAMPRPPPITSGRRAVQQPRTWWNQGGQGNVVNPGGRGAVAVSASLLLCSRTRQSRGQRTCSIPPQHAAGIAVGNDGAYCQQTQLCTRRLACMPAPQSFNDWVVHG